MRPTRILSPLHDRRIERGNRAAEGHAIAKGGRRGQRNLHGEPNGIP
jgi:hypothetical protein